MEYFREKEKLLLMEGSLTIATLTEELDCLRKYFSYFRGNFTDSEIRKKKKWRNAM